MIFLRLVQRSMTPIVRGVTRQKLFSRHSDGQVSQRVHNGASALGYRVWWAERNNVHCGANRQKSSTGATETGASETGASETGGTLPDRDAKMRQSPDVKEWLRHLQEDFAVKQDDIAADSSSSSDSDSDKSSDFDSDIRKSERRSEETTPTDVDLELSRYDYEEYTEDYESSEAQDFDMQSEVSQSEISFERGETGVYDVDELVDLLEREKAADVRVIQIPPEFHYVDHMVLATGKSTRHIYALAEYVLWVYKQKCRENDRPSVRIEGKDSKEWLAMDMGNIVLHIFLEATRERYDLERLWLGLDSEEEEHAEIDTDIDNFNWDQLFHENTQQNEKRQKNVD